MKYLGKIISFFTALALIISALPVAVINATVYDSAVTKINQIKITYPVGSYFTDNGKACNDGHANCSYYNDARCNCKIFDSAIQCRGFVRYVFYHMFSVYYTQAGSKTTVFSYTSTNIPNETAMKNMLKTLRPGDIVDITGGESHAFVVSNTDPNGVKVTAYEANYGSKCMINERDIPLSTFLNKYTAITIYRAANYDLKYPQSDNPPTSNGFSYITVGNNISIVKYYGSEANVIVPDKIDGKTVIVISDAAFADNAAIKTVKFPSSIISMGNDLFKNSGLNDMICLKDSVAHQYAISNHISYRLDLESFNATLSTSSYTYDASAKSPTVTIKDGNKTLTKNTDYTISYSNNIHAGKGTVTITGKGNYAGTKTCTFTISKKSISVLTATLSTSSYTYNGVGKMPAVTLKGGSTALVKDTDYTVRYTNNKNAGKGTVTITGRGNYTGTKTCTFTISKKSISGLTATLSTSSYAYNGVGKMPTVTLKNGSTILVKNIDYTVRYSNNKEVGEGTVTITGRGNYTSTKTVYFKINPKAVILSSVSSPSTKNIKITWTQNSQASGYEVQTAIESSFKTWCNTYAVSGGGTTSKTIGGKTSGKSYYARVRVYKTVGSTKYYSSWSSTKSVKIK